MGLVTAILRHALGVIAMMLRKVRLNRERVAKPLRKAIWEILSELVRSSWQTAWIRVSAK